MKALVCAALVALAGTIVVAEETKLGAGVTLTEATSIEKLLEAPEQYVGKTVRVDGVATAVCAHNGCWMAVAADAAPDAKSVRVKVEDNVIVIPVTAKGKQVSAEGVFEEVKAQGHGAAGGHAQHDAKKTYQLKGTGVIIR